MPCPVIFDLFQTLVDGADDERDRVIREMALVVGVDPAAFVAAYHATWRQRLVQWGVEMTVDILARRLGATPTEEQVRQAAALRRAMARRVLDAVSPGTLAVLDELRADGHPMALISNATSDSAEAWPMSRLASRFEVAVFSCEVGLAKPDPRIYRLAADRLGVVPTECVFVGDGADGELDGAAGVGMTVFRITEHNDNAPGWDGPVLSTVADLPISLRELGTVRRIPT